MTLFTRVIKREIDMECQVTHYEMNRTNYPF